MEYIKISIVVITYNQQDIIGRCLDSILCQKEYGLKEIIVCDDCSTDRNWEKINEYLKKYPNYLRAYRNEQNRGIFGNIQKALTYIQKTDLIQLCSGDDALCYGYFKRIQDFIQMNSIVDFDKKFAIYSDWKNCTPDSKEYFFYNNYICKGFNACSLKLRHLIFNRSTFLSYAAIKSFYEVPVNEGVSVAENLFDIQYQIHSDKNYYCPYVGSIYYSGIGVSTKMHSINHINNLILSYEKLRLLGIFDQKDLLYIDYLKCRLRYNIKKNVLLFFKTWCYYFRSIRYRVDFKFICRDFINMLIK